MIKITITRIIQNEIAACSQLLSKEGLLKGTYCVFVISAKRQLKIYDNTIVMGCGPQKKESVPLVWTHTPIGILKATVLDTSLPAEPKLVNPFTRLRVTNQFFTRKITPVDLDNPSQPTYEYYINSFYQSQGRAFEVGAFEGEQFKAYGAADINPVINNPDKPQEFRVILGNEAVKKYGYVTLRLVFSELSYRKIAFRYEAATIRRGTSAFGSNNIAVRTTVGEEVLTTKFKEDSDETPPTWADESFKFLVPDGVKTAQVELIDEGYNVVGKTNLELEELFQIKQGNEVYAAEELFKVVQGKQIDAASLKFSYIIGEEPTFSVVRNVLKSSMRGTRPASQQRSASKIEKSEIRE